MKKLLREQQFTSLCWTVFCRELLTRDRCTNKYWPLVTKYIINIYLTFCHCSPSITYSPSRACNRPSMYECMLSFNRRRRTKAQHKYEINSHRSDIIIIYCWQSDFVPWWKWKTNEECRFHKYKLHFNHLHPHMRWSQALNIIGNATNTYFTITIEFEW